MRSIELVASRILSSTPLRVASATGGTSTLVFRIVYPRETSYIRLLPTTDACASEVAVHRQVRQKHVRVPEVIHFEQFDDVPNGAIIVTTAIKGSALSDTSQLDEDTLQAMSPALDGTSHGSTRFLSTASGVYALQSIASI
jgi:hypothetical protein